MKYEGALDAYQKLDYQQKKVRLMTLFELFQEHSVAIQKMLPLLQSDGMKEDEMIQAYANLVTAMENVEQKSLEKSFSKLEELQAKIEAMRKEEAQERQQEHPDDLLKNL